MLSSPLYRTVSLSPPQKKYEGLLSITIDYYWKSSYLLIYLLPYFSHWINAFQDKTSDVVIFEQITDPLGPFSFSFSFFNIL